MMTGIPEGIIVLILTAIGVVGWFAIRRIIEGQDKILAAQVTTNERLGQINGRVGKAETRMEMHEKQDEERHEQMEREQMRIWAAIERGRA